MIEYDTNIGDLISRQAAIAEIKDYIVDPDKAVSEYEDNVFNYNAGLKSAVQAVVGLPPAERKIGKWVNDGKGLYKCTACGELWLHWWATVMPIERMYKEMRFCPHCGAKMERNEDADN